MQHLSNEIIVFGNGGPPFLHDFWILFIVFFHVAAEAAFLLDLCGFGPPKSSLLELIFADFADFA